MDYSLSDSELVLLLLVAEQPDINGYGIRRRVEERGMAAWAGVASSSIYNRLKQMEERGLARSAPDTKKQDRGPRGQVYRLTGAGRRAMKKAIAESLASTREHDPRFNIALCGVDELGPAVAAQALDQRAEFLGSAHADLTAFRGDPSELPLTADLLYDRILHGMEAERAWTITAAARLRSAAQTGPEAKP